MRGQNNRPILTVEKPIVKLYYTIEEVSSMTGLTKGMVYFWRGEVHKKYKIKRATHSNRLSRQELDKILEITRINQ